MLFVLAAGRLSKVVITEAFPVLRKDSFIDVGSAIDGYAGRLKPGFVSGGLRHYCRSSSSWVPPDGVERRWMAPGVCKESHLWLWMACSVFAVIWVGVLYFAFITADKHTSISEEVPAMQELSRRRNEGGNRARFKVE